MNGLYDSAREAFLSGDISWDRDDIKVTLVKAGYEPDLASDRYYSVLSSRDLMAAYVKLEDRTATGGIADAADVIFPRVPAGIECTHLVVWKDTGENETSLMIVCIDNAPGLPIVTTGGNVEIVWDRERGLFQL